MFILACLIAYLGILLFVIIITMKCAVYLKKPQHVRWELYPVPHEEASRAVYGGSYMEKADWWKKIQQPSWTGTLKGFLEEAALLRTTLRHNRTLWLRTYPFHLGLYLLAGSVGLALFSAILALCGISLPMLVSLGQLTTLLAFGGLCVGTLGLIQRRLNVPDLRNFSTPEHFLNLGLFFSLGFIGLLAWLSPQEYFKLLVSFITGLLTFSFEQAAFSPFLFNLHMILMFLLLAYVPLTHMGHVFMKYFLWHDIRWGDQPAGDNPAIQQKIPPLLSQTVSWKAPHIKGDGVKTWAEVATTNPTQNKE